MKQPVAVALNGSKSAFKFYKSGVLKSCCNPNDRNCRENSLRINHGVTVVGYSEKSTGTRKCSVNDWWVGCEGGEADDDGDSGYWKVMNSYGTSWGDNGFIKIALEGPTSQGVCRINYAGAHYAEWDFPEDQH